MSFEDKSAIYCSLVALVKAEYSFDNTLQNRAARFLKRLKPKWGDKQLAAKLVTDLVPSSDGSPSGFVESILTLLSSPHLTIVSAALSVLHNTNIYSTLDIRCRLVESDLVSKVLAIVQPQTLPISENGTMLNKLNLVIIEYLKLAHPSTVSELGLTTAIDKYNHCELIFQRVMLPSSQFVTFLISNRHILSGGLLNSFMHILCARLQTGPFHRPTLEFVLASPIAMAFSSCLSFIENDFRLWVHLLNINSSLDEWNAPDPEVVQSGKQMIQALFSEGFEDTLEQTLKHDKSESFGDEVVETCHSISQLLGSNVEFTENDDEEDFENESDSFEDF